MSEYKGVNRLEELGKAGLRAIFAEEPGKFKDGQKGKFASYGIDTTEQDERAEEEMEYILRKAREER